MDDDDDVCVCVCLCVCTYVHMLACIYLYVAKGEDKEVVRIAEEIDKNFPLCSGNCFKPFRPFDFSFIPQDAFIKHLLRAGTIHSPGDSLRELSLEEEIAGKYVVKALVKAGFPGQGTK